MRYYTYWSIADAPTNTLKAYFIFFVIAGLFAVAWLILKYWKKYKEDTERKLLLWATLIISILSFIGGIYFKFIFVDNTEMHVKEYLESSYLKTVEGEISDFKRSVEHKKYLDVTTERFTVDSVTFSYSDALLGQFNSFGKTYNKKLVEGVPVRITYTPQSHLIQKVEIANGN